MANDEYVHVYWIEDGESGAGNFESLEQFKRTHGERATYAAHVYRNEDDWTFADVFIGTLNDPAHDMAKLYAQENL